MRSRPREIRGCDEAELCVLPAPTPGLLAVDDVGWKRGADIQYAASSEPLLWYLEGLGGELRRRGQYGDSAHLE